MEKPNTHPDKNVGFTSWQELANAHSGIVILPCHSKLAGTLVDEGLMTPLRFGGQIRADDLSNIAERALEKKDLSLLPITNLSYNDKGDLVISLSGSQSAKRIHKAFADRYGVSYRKNPIVNPYLETKAEDDD